MDPEALRRLAPAHAVALAGIEAGLDEEVIAAALRVPVEAMPSLVRIARAKLAAAAGARPDAPESDGD